MAVKHTRSYIVGPDQTREYQPKDHYGVVFTLDDRGRNVAMPTFEHFASIVEPWCEAHCAGGFILDHFIMWFEREDDAMLCLLALG